MFKLPDGLPSLKSSAQDWADYAEYLSIEKGEISLLSLIKTPLLVSDEIEVNGLDDDTDAYNNKADDIAKELQYRIDICKGRYPFKLINHDYSLKYFPNTQETALVYRFLLFATRVNMGRDRIHSEIDGALLFERLSALIALEFFGDNSEVDFLGTSKTNAGGFREKLREITGKIREGGDIHENIGHRPQDDNVDLVVWKGFTDKLPSQMIAFGQCKTGTSWRDKLSELNTDSFCKTWFTRQPVLTPVRLFFSAQYFPRDIWHVRANEAGLVFDRFRIMDYLPNELDQEILLNIKTWTKAVEDKYLH